MSVAVCNFFVQSTLDPLCEVTYIRHFTLKVLSQNNAMMDEFEIVHTVRALTS